MAHEHDGGPPLVEEGENAYPIDPHGLTEPYGADPGTAPRAESNPLGARPVSVPGVLGEKFKRELLKDLFPEEEAEREAEQGPLTIGRYLIRHNVGTGGLIGKGGMGMVFALEDKEGLERYCVAKLIRGAAHPDAVARAQREARVLAKFRHPNIVSVFDSGTTDAGEFFIVMEYVPGETLAEWHRGARPWREVAEVYLQAGRGLAEAHRQGVIHRDFKPSNVMLVDPCAARTAGSQAAAATKPESVAASKRGSGSAAETTASAQPRTTGPEEARTATKKPEHEERTGLRRIIDFFRRGAPRESVHDVRVLDFGLAVLTSRPVPPPGTNRQIKPGTRDGVKMGTVGYMPPEQIRGEKADERSDQFSFCVSLYEALFGFLPFGPLPPSTRDRTTAETMTTHYEDRAKRGEVDTPAGLQGAQARLFAVLRRGLEPDRKDRYPSMGELLAALERELGRTDRIARRVGLAGALVLGVALGTRMVGSQVEFNQCLARSTELAEVWDADRDGDELRLMVPDARGHAGLVKRLDDFKAGWLAQRRLVCLEDAQLWTAADVGGAIECLDDHLEVFKETVGGLLAGSGKAMGNLDELADGARLAECRSRSVAPTPRRTPEAAARATEIRSLLSQAEAKLLLADYTESRRAADQALRLATLLGEPRLLARAYNQVARAQTYGLDRAGVVPLLEQAAALAERHELYDLAADVYLRRIRLAALADPPDEAVARAYDLMLKRTLDLLGPAGVGTREVDRLLYMTRLETTLGRLPAAADSVQQAEALAKDGSPFLRARVHDELAGIAFRAKNFDAALKEHKEALHLREQEFGKEHPRLLVALTNLTLTQLNRGELSEAAGYLARARGLMAKLPHDPIDALWVHTAASQLASRAGEVPGFSHVRAGLALIDKLELGEATRSRELDLLDAALDLAIIAGQRPVILEICRKVHGYLPLRETRRGLDYILARAGMAASEFADHELAHELLSVAVPDGSFRTMDIAYFHLSRARTLLALGEPSAALGEAAAALRMVNELEAKDRSEPQSIYSRALAQLKDGPATLKPLTP